jgi:hypothetical protein
MWREAFATEMKEEPMPFNSTTLALTWKMVVMKKKRAETLTEERMSVPTHIEHERHASLYTSKVNITSYPVPRTSYIHPLSLSASELATKYVPASAKALAWPSRRYNRAWRGATFVYDPKQSRLGRER